MCGLLGNQAAQTRGVAHILLHVTTILFVRTGHGPWRTPGRLLRRQGKQMSHTSCHTAPHTTYFMRWQRRGNTSHGAGKGCSAPSDMRGASHMRVCDHKPAAMIYAHEWSSTSTGEAINACVSKSAADARFDASLSKQQSRKSLSAGLAAAAHSSTGVHASGLRTGNPRAAMHGMHTHQGMWAARACPPHDASAHAWQ